MSYFVRIDEPKRLRKTILKGAKETILYQYRYKEYAELKQKKLSLMQDIDEAFEKLNEKTELLLDELDVEELEEDIQIQQETEEDEEEQDESEEDTSEEALSDADRLKYTLDRIESTLDNL
jgi:hypothetical protein